ncbi:riboflavin kinase, partial [PVC group bacterium]|nr:riboflavin kinase [PVC group bacterium]
FNQVVTLPGVYLVRVKFNKNIYNGLLNIGPRAKFLEGKTLFIRKEKDEIKIEIHILNFRSTIYGKTLFVEIIKKLRDTQKFNDADSLKRQVFLDIKKARLFFKKQKKR